MRPEGFIYGILLIVVGLPVTLAMIAEVIKRHIAYKERKLELMADKTAEKAAQYAAHVERLEQRMRVLDPGAADAARRTTGETDGRVALCCADVVAGVATTKRLPTTADAARLVAPVMLMNRGDIRAPPTFVYEPLTENFTSRVIDLFASLSVILISSR